MTECGEYVQMQPSCVEKEYFFYTNTDGNCGCYAQDTMDCAIKDGFESHLDVYRYSGSCDGGGNKFLVIVVAFLLVCA